MQMRIIRVIPSLLKENQLESPSSRPFKNQNWKLKKPLHDISFHSLTFTATFSREQQQIDIAWAYRGSKRKIAYRSELRSNTKRSLFMPRFFRQLPLPSSMAMKPRRTLRLNIAFPSDVGSLNKLWLFLRSYWGLNFLLLRSSSSE